jgi:hypothetical protein
MKIIFKITCLTIIIILSGFTNSYGKTDDNSTSAADALFESGLDESALMVLHSQSNQPNTDPATPSIRNAREQKLN